MRVRNVSLGILVILTACSAGTGGGSAGSTASASESGVATAIEMASATALPTPSPTQAPLAACDLGSPQASSGLSGSDQNHQTLADFQQKAADESDASLKKALQDDADQLGQLGLLDYCAVTVTTATQDFAGYTRTWVFPDAAAADKWLAYTLPGDFCKAQTAPSSVAGENVEATICGMEGAERAFVAVRVAGVLRLSVAQVAQLSGTITQAMQDRAYADAVTSAAAIDAALPVIPAGG